MKLRSGNREMEAVWCGVNCPDLFTHAVVALSWVDSLLAIKCAAIYPVTSGSCYFPNDALISTIVSHESRAFQTKVFNFLVLDLL